MSTDTLQVTRTARTLLFSSLDYGIKSNGRYTSDDFDRLLGRIATRRQFANSGATAAAVAADPTALGSVGPRSPLAKAFLYHLGHLTEDEIDRQFRGVLTATMRRARRARRFHHPVDVAIDIHDWPFYGHRETDHVLVVNRTRGTNRGYRFATLCVVESGTRFMLGWVPLTQNAYPAKRDAVRSLLLQAQRFVQIRRVYLDRGFYQVPVVETLIEFGVKFVMRAIQYKPIAALVADADTDVIVTDYVMKRKRPPYSQIQVRLLVVPHLTNDDEWTCFITNRSVTEATAQAVAEDYRRRWGIETAYRQIRELLPRTSSRTFAVRLFYFLFALSVYNLWVLVNRLGAPLAHADSRLPLISTAVFGELLFGAG